MFILAQLLLILLCMTGAAFFAGIETGVISLNRLRLRHLVRHNVPGAAVMEYFLHDPDHLLATTLIGTNLCHVGASVLAASLGVRLLGAPGGVAATALIAASMLVFSEYLPKAWFQSAPTLRALPFARLLKLSAQALLPVSWTLMQLMRAAIPSRGRDTRQGEPAVTREELLHLAHEGEQTGILSHQERQMIHYIIELREKTCGEIMVPKKDVMSVNTDTRVDELLKLARDREFNRFPVYDALKKAFVGVVNVFDVLCDPEPGAKTVRDYMRPPQLVSHHTPTDHVLPRMRVTRQPLVLVLDDRYEFVGIVTIEDVLEDIVGRM